MSNYNILQLKDIGYWLNKSTHEAVIESLKQVARQIIFNTSK